MQNLEDIAIDELKKRNPGSKKFKIQGKSENFMGGTLMIFDSKDEDGDIVEDFIFMKNDEITIYNNAIDLAQGLKQTVPTSFLENFFSYKGISAVIAMILLITICLLVILKIEIPDIISSSFGLVIGFYFGQRVK